LIEAIVPWEATRNEAPLNQARYEIARSVARSRGDKLPSLDAMKPKEIIDYLQANAPRVYDPFCGGGDKLGRWAEARLRVDVEGGASSGDDRSDASSTARRRQSSAIGSMPGSGEGGSIAPRLARASGAAIAASLAVLSAAAKRREKQLSFRKRIGSSGASSPDLGEVAPTRTRKSVRALLLGLRVVSDTNLPSTDLTFSRAPGLR
jgi:hypothetical protein